MNPLRAITGNRRVIASLLAFAALLMVVAGVLLRGPLLSQVQGPECRPYAHFPAITTYDVPMPASQNNFPHRLPSIVTANLDGNTHKDVVVSRGPVGGFAVYKGDGNGRFNEPDVYTAPGIAGETLVMDIDLDGDMDIVLAVSNADVYGLIYRNNGSGLFTVAGTLGDGVPGAGLFSLAGAHAFEAGRLLIAGQNANSTIIFTDNGSGGFDIASTYVRAVPPSPPEHSLPSVSPASNTSVFLKDMDGDSRADLIHADRYGSAEVRRGNNDGTFGDSIPSPSPDSISTSFAVANLDGDGRPDVVQLHPLTTGWYSSMTVWKNDGSGRLTSAVELTPPERDMVFRRLTVRDLNKDGVMDILSTLEAPDGDFLMPFYAETLQTLSYPTPGRLHALPDAYAITVDDMNDDGKADILTTNDTGSCAGGGAFTLHRNETCNDAPLYVGNPSPDAGSPEIWCSAPSAGSPDVCTPLCGDSIRAGSEQCDDGNTVSGDGCSAACTTEGSNGSQGSTGSAGSASNASGNGSNGSQGSNGSTGSQAGNGSSGLNGSSGSVGSQGSRSSGSQGSTGSAGSRGSTGSASVTSANGSASSRRSVSSRRSSVRSLSISSRRVSSRSSSSRQSVSSRRSSVSSAAACSPTLPCPSGFSCVAGFCATVCGDGIVAGTEQCDDGNTVNNDTCTSTCRTSTGQACTEDSQCATQLCIDGICQNCGPTNQCREGMVCIAGICTEAESLNLGPNQVGTVVIDLPGLLPSPENPGGPSIQIPGNNPLTGQVQGDVTVLSDGALLLPDGSRLLPDGGVVLSDGSVVGPTPLGIQRYQQRLLEAQQNTRAPAGETGPAAVAVMAAGAAAGWAFVRRKRRASL